MYEKYQVSKLELPKAGSGNRIGACLFLPRMQICHVAEQLWVPRVQILALVSEKSRKVIFTDIHTVAQWQEIAGRHHTSTIYHFHYHSIQPWHPLQWQAHCSFSSLSYSMVLRSFSSLCRCGDEAYQRFCRRWRFAQ